MTAVKRVLCSLADCMYCGVDVVCIVVFVISDVWMINSATSA